MHGEQADGDLSRLSTFRLAARAGRLIELTSLDQLETIDPNVDESVLVLGGGSNTLFMADWPGTVLLNRLRGLEIRELGDERVDVTAAAGENWHQLVRHCLDRGLYGLENLIMIPGSVGAAPMQNIGAYGVELADTLVSVTAWDWQAGELVTLDREACQLDYRDSRFKSTDQGRFLITSVTLSLSRRFEPRLGYASLRERLADRPNTPLTPRQLAAAVMRLRRHRLPDPSRLANAGSFFKNPIVERAEADRLLGDWPRLAHWPMADGRVKLAAGWLIERLGFRGHRIGDAGVYRHHALVLVNHGHATAAQLAELIDEVILAVHTEYGVSLEPEPRLMGWSPTKKPG